MIESCGRTLLDTFNNLLDYAKISRVAHSSKYADKELAAAIRLKDGSLNTLYDMSHLVQEVVDGIHLGFVKTSIQATPAGQSFYAVIEESSSHSTHTIEEPVLVTVHVENRPNWIISLDVGSWKRIVMNLFGKNLTICRTSRFQLIPARKRTQIYERG
jgi:hypothetical protein